MSKKPKVSILINTYNQEVLAIRALDSIPRRDDIEVIVSDDASTDNTYPNLVKYKKEHPELNMKLYHNKENMGCYAHGNKSIHYATGEYLHCLDNDDYLYTDKYNQVLDMVDGEYDAYYMNLEINDGTILVLNEQNRHAFCAPTTRIVRRSLLEDLEFHVELGGLLDGLYNEEFLKKNPKSKYTYITAYHHNFPREGSVTDMFRKGLLK